jgi:hypothetical protein
MANVGYPERVSLVVEASHEEFEIVLANASARVIPNSLTQREDPG